MEDTLQNNITLVGEPLLISVIYLILNSHEYT